MALAVLSALSTEDLQRACAGGDAATVARAQGVGPKLASRIVNELREKAGALPNAPGVVASPTPGSASADAISALQNLGFKPPVAGAAVARAVDELGEGAALNDLVRVALRRAAG
jgi:Holliday junction DNA helicase RuvA